jgi:hypothetical protein
LPRVGSIEAGSDFREAIQRAIYRSAVCLVIIGRNWLSIANPRRAKSAKISALRVPVTPRARTRVAQAMAITGDPRDCCPPSAINAEWGCAKLLPH